MKTEEWLKTCHFCHKPIKFLEKKVGSLKKKIVYHEKCYEDIVLNFGTEKERQDYFKMKEVKYP